MNRINESKRSQCFKCKIFYDQSVILYEHQAYYNQTQNKTNIKCNKKYCYSCLYLLYLDADKNKNKDLLLPCCQCPMNINKMKQSFLTNCIFCGDYIRGKLYKKVIYNNTFVYCHCCYKNYLQSKNKFQRHYQEIAEKILNLSLNLQCKMCEQPLGLLDLKYNQNQKESSVQAYNYQLCRECFCDNIQNLKLTTIAESFIARTQQIQISFLGKVSNNYSQCCTCKQKILINKKQQNHLFQWKDKKIYCNICLFFKIDNKIIGFLKQSRNQLNTIQIIRIHKLLTTYIHHFSNKCCICGCLDQKNKQKEKYTLSFKNKQQNQLNGSYPYDKIYFFTIQQQSKDKVSLPLHICKKCYQYLLHDASKFNRLAAFQIEIKLNHENFRRQLQKINQQDNQKLKKQSIKLFSKQKQKKPTIQRSKSPNNNHLNRQNNQNNTGNNIVFQQKVVYQNIDNLKLNYESHFQSFCASYKQKKCKYCSNTQKILHFNSFCSNCFKIYLANKDQQTQFKIQGNQLQNIDSKWKKIEQQTKKYMNGN